MTKTSQRPCCYGPIILQFPTEVNCVFAENKKICRIFLCAMQKRETLRKIPAERPPER